MATLSLNEIKDRALAFSKDYKAAFSEIKEKQSFWIEFFNIFGIKPRRVSTFEASVKKLSGETGFIDLFWPGTLLVEHKSRGKNLDSAYLQAIDYTMGLSDKELPRYIVVSDFAQICLYDLENGEKYQFPLEELYQNVALFVFIAGYQRHAFGEQDPVNIKAAERLGRLHDYLKEKGYTGHKLEVLLVRLLFCLFAEDTTIFEKAAFWEYLEQRTAEDGSDLGMHLAQLFQVLNTPEDQRQSITDEQRAAFPYVDGELFSETLPTAETNHQMRETLLHCAELDWGRISPAVFGSLFQSIMDPEARRNLGAHYTTEKNILKLLRPLFLDDLRTEFESLKKTPRKLNAFHEKLARIRILDPACGCGNFLVIAYRELRKLELELLKVIFKDQTEVDIQLLVKLDVDRFYGIEQEEFPAQIARVALWLTDHQMNIEVSQAFGQYFTRIPIASTPHIVRDNALSIDWRDVVAPGQLSYICGNPPFGGKKEQHEAQKGEVLRIFHDVKGAGVLDYVASWYRKAVEFMADNPAIRAAFVSTNSITQGEQVGILWPDLLKRGVKIHFAHRTFQWSSEARGKAAVHCVIVGFGLQDVAVKWLFDYDTPKSEPHAIKVSNINSYLVDGLGIFIINRRHPISDVPEVTYGSFALDDGYYTLSPSDRVMLLEECPAAKKYIRQFIGGRELIHNEQRYCLWFNNADPAELRSLGPIRRRIEAVRSWRLASGRETTRRLAATPAIFAEIRQPDQPYLAFPTVSSENRSYIPIAFLPEDVIASNQIYVLVGANYYHFGVLSSLMHMAWVRVVCGRLESRYRYSIRIVYNNFPWPTPSTKQQQRIEAAAENVLHTRELYPKATLADLYDPLTMPPPLLRAHKRLDRAVDAAYGVKGFDSEAERVAFLFELYRRLTETLELDRKKTRYRRK